MINTESKAARNRSVTEPGNDKLIDDLRAVITDAEELMTRAKGSTTGSYAAIRAEVQDKLDDAIVKLRDARTAVRERTQHATEATDQFVRDNPWKSMGYVAAAALILGLLITRRH
jgi:ElaB/YqjD/DUF883 family membrane-anchored ribosome-binding protein